MVWSTQCQLSGSHPTAIGQPSLRASRAEAAPRGRAHTAPGARDRDRCAGPGRGPQMGPKATAHFWRLLEIFRIFGNFWRFYFFFETFGDFWDLGKLFQFFKDVSQGRRARRWAVVCTDCRKSWPPSEKGAWWAVSLAWRTEQVDRSLASVNNIQSNLSAI